jgi:hypothetical protein
VLSVSTWTVAALTCAGSGPDREDGAGALPAVGAGFDGDVGVGLGVGVEVAVGVGWGVPWGGGVGVPDGGVALGPAGALDGAATATAGVVTAGRPLPRRTETITRPRRSAIRVVPVLASPRTAIPPHRDPPPRRRAVPAVER